MLSEGACALHSKCFGLWCCCVVCGRKSVNCPRAASSVVWANEVVTNVLVIRVPLED